MRSPLSLANRLPPADLAFKEQRGGVSQSRCNALGLFGGIGVSGHVLIGNVLTNSSVCSRSFADRVARRVGLVSGFSAHELRRGWRMLQMQMNDGVSPRNRARLVVGK